MKNIIYTSTILFITQLLIACGTNFIGGAVINNSKSVTLRETVSNQVITIPASSGQQTEFEFEVVEANYRDGFYIVIEDDKGQNCTITDNIGDYNNFPKFETKIQCPDADGKRYSGNPVIRNQYTADPTAITVGDYLYVYVGKDETSLFHTEVERCSGTPFGCKLEQLETWGGFDITGYHVYRTKNMVDWEYIGPVLEDKDVPWMYQTWAGHIVEKDGLYYLYTTSPTEEINYVSYVLDTLQTFITEFKIQFPNGPRASVGVAVSNWPEGPFYDIGAPLIPWGYPGAINSIMDPATFIDDDGQAYMFYGGGSKAQYVKLNDDMISFDGVIREITGVDGSNPIPDFVEGIYIHKRNDIYYLSYSKSSFGEDYDGLAYATADNINGPWTYQGDFLGDVNIMTNHGAIINFKGQDYLLYHNGRLPGIKGKHYLNDDFEDSLATRAMTVDKLSYTADGKIVFVQQTEIGVPEIIE